MIQTLKAGDAVDVAQVRSAIRDMLPEPASIEIVALHLGMSKRALQRLLANHATNFRLLRQHECFLEAVRLLEIEALRIEEVACRVGYTDPSHFSRAFQRWTGCSPTSWRSLNRRRAFLERLARNGLKEH